MKEYYRETESPALKLTIDDAVYEIDPDSLMEGEMVFDGVLIQYGDSRGFVNGAIVTDLGRMNMSFKTGGRSINIECDGSGYTHEICREYDDLDGIVIETGKVELCKGSDRIYIEGFLNDEPEVIDGVMTAANFNGKLYVPEDYDLLLTGKNARVKGTLSCNTADIRVERVNMNDIDAKSVEIMTYRNIQIKNVAANALSLASRKGDLSMQDIHTDSLFAHIREGDIAVSDITSNELTLSVNGGDISMRDITSDYIDSKTQGGDITASNLMGDTVKLETNGGDISMHDITSDSICGRTNGGDISAKTMDYDTLNITSEGGDIRVHLYAGHEADIRTSGGDISAVVHADIKIEAITYGGDMRASNCSRNGNTYTPRSGNVIGEASIRSSGGDIRIKYR